MAESVVSSVGQTIGKLLIHETKFLWGVERKVKDLRKELELIQAFLRDADARQNREEAVGVWVVQLQDIAFDAEDVIEKYILRVALKKKGQNTIKAFACFVAKCTCLQVHVVGTEIERLKSSISNLRTSMQAYGLQPVKEGEREQAKVSKQRLTYAHIEEDFVGREDNIEELVKQLLKDGKQYRIISIWGMGGLGKTSLTRKVLAHDKVKKNFDGFAWACISQEFHVKDILVEILVKLIPDQRERVMKMIVQELFEALHKIQKEKRCIVVLDDIWTKEAWNSLRDAFPTENTRSKLLITTRKRDVAGYINPQGPFHELRCLNDEESWDLLKKRAFPELKEITEDMRMLGNKLLKKCGGLPLAVKVLGGLLAANKWEEIYKNINSYLGGDDDVSKVFALSYDDLAWYLKPCFLYLASFPEDEEIPVKKVLYMWIAEGFVLATAYGKEREIPVEDVAKRHLTELVNRGMVQVQFNLSGKIKSCHLHDVMREFCIPKIRHERFLSILNIQQDHETEECSSSKGESTFKTRRLSLNMRVSTKGNTIPRVEQIGRTMLHLRTLMFFHYGPSIEGTWDQFQSIFINCRFLRVLKLENVSQMGGNLPESVGDLVHLRFLSLARSEFKGLPQSMGNLICMEFLDLHTTSICTVPNVLWKMRRLSYLRLPRLFVVKEELYGVRKLRLDTLKNLQILRNFRPNRCDVNDVGKLTNLQRMTFFAAKCDDDELEMIPQLAKFDLEHLQSLSFRFRRLDSFKEGEVSKIWSYPRPCKLSIEGRLEKLLEHKNLPQQLTKLVLMYSRLEEDPMPMLEKLPGLVVLMLGYKTFMGKEMICSAGGFPQLNYLIVHDLPNLEVWSVIEGAMPHLSRLGIGECPKLKAVPELEGVRTYDGGEDVEHEFYKL